MQYELLLRAHGPYGAKLSCAPAMVSTGAVSTTNATITVSNTSSLWFAWVGDTEYDMDAGDAAHNYSFKGADPHAANVRLLSAIPATYSTFRTEHVTDIHNTLGAFKLSLGIPTSVDLSTPTDQLVAQYRQDTGDPYLEWLTFNYGRYMLASSSRGSLPANLQGKWAFDSSNAWSADYRALSPP
jgi:alpha-L-fucosidase 2